MNIKHSYVLLGSLLVIAVSIVVIFLVPNPSKPQYNVLGIVLALGAAAFAVSLPGTLQVNFNNLVKGTGALGMAGLVIIVMFWISKYEPLTFASISGSIDIPGDTNGEDIATGIRLSITPPLIVPPLNGQLAVSGIPILEGSNAPVLRIQKDGFKEVQVPIEANASITPLKNFIVTRNGDLFQITTPIVLEPRRRSTSTYVPDTSHTAVPTNVSDNGGNP